MKSDGIAYGIAGIAFGLVAGWVIGAQKVPGLSSPPPAPAATAQAAPAAQTGAPPPQPLDEAKVNALKAAATQQPNDAKSRVDLGNMYFDAQRYQDAIAWYGEALKLNPKDVNVSTDLGLSYWYTDQADKALAQFDESLKIDPNHAKTLMNVGVVRAMGKQDLAGAEAIWNKLVQVAPDSPEAQSAKRVLESLKSAHPAGAPGTKPGA
jgi:tetratricopeptide (TPR) repeat protein